MKHPHSYERFLKTRAALERLDRTHPDYSRSALLHWRAVVDCLAEAPNEFGIAQANTEQITPCVKVPHRVLEAAVLVLQGELARKPIESFSAASGVGGGQGKHPLAAAAAKFAVEYCVASKAGLTGDRSWAKTITEQYEVARNTLTNWKDEFRDVASQLPLSGLGLSNDQTHHIYKHFLEHHACNYKKFRSHA